MSRLECINSEIERLNTPYSEQLHERREKIAEKVNTLLQLQGTENLSVSEIIKNAVESILNEIILEETYTYYIKLMQSQGKTVVTLREFKLTEKNICIFSNIKLIIELGIHPGCNVMLKTGNTRSINSISSKGFLYYEGGGNSEPEAVDYVIT